MNWFKFFLGTPPRFIATMLVLGVIACAINPYIFVEATHNLTIACEPLIRLLIIAAVGMFLVRKVFGSKKK